MTNNQVALCVTGLCYPTYMRNFHVLQHIRTDHVSIMTDSR